MWESLKKENILLILIDFQEKFFPLLSPVMVKAAKSNILLTIRMFKKLNIPMIGTEHYVKGLGHTEEEVSEEWGGSDFIDKLTFSCCREEGFLKKLEGHKKPVIVIAGLETHICVLQTVLDLIQRNYRVAVLTDAVISSTKHRWQNGLDLMEKAGALLINTESLLFYLLQRVDTQEFKYLVHLLKEGQAKD